MLLMFDDDDKKLFILKAEVSRRPLCSVMGWSILAPEHIVHRAQATNPKSHSHTFSVSEIRDFGVIFRLIWIFDLVTEKRNDTRNEFVLYGPKLHEYMTWLKSCDVKRSRRVSRTRGWLVDLWAEELRRLSEVTFIWGWRSLLNHGKEVFWQIGHSILVALSCGPRPVLSPSQLSTLLLKWYLSASRCTRQLRRAIKSCSGLCIHVTVDKISAAPQQLLQPQQSDS